jgi:putative colanic acid biosynthesis acetyltransferase WcaF
MGKTDLSSYNNSWYSPGGNPIKRLFWYFTNVIWFNSSFPFNGFKILILKLFGCKVGKGVVIKPHVKIKYPWMLEIGNNVWIGENVWIDNLAKVTIGNNVCISQGAFLLCGNHNYKKSTFDLIISEIVLEDGTWIGAKSVVCPGVKCFTHSVLTVGSIASSNLEAYTVYQGNPAVKIKERIVR